MITLLLTALLSVAQANDPTNRIAEVHQHKVCGPVPWEAFQVSEYGQVKDSSTTVGVEGEGDALTQSGSGKMDVATDKTVSQDGEAFALPVSGDQWMMMYMTYMDCVTRSEMGEEVGDLWKAALRNKEDASFEDVSKFVRSTAILLHPSADTWWEHFEELLDAKFDVQDAQIKAERDRVDTLYADVRDLRQKYADLAASHAALEQAFQDFKKEAQEQDTVLWKHVIKLEKLVEDLSDDVHEIKDDIVEKAANS